MCGIKHKILVLSGKGGVGKSTVAVNVAASLAMAGKKVGLLDSDIHGPSIPKMLHVEGAPVVSGDTSLSPVKVGMQPGLLSVMSIGFLLRGRDDAVIWRGPAKHGVIKQFLKDVDWGNLDYLVVDSPPGTGDEPLSVIQLIENADGAIIVTTPQQVAVQDVRRSIMFCRQLSLNVLGVVEKAPESLAKNGSLKIAIPVAQGMLSMHFGHCEQFALFDVDPGSKTIVGKTVLDPPAHEPGVLPRWLHEQKANVVITGGMGARAQSLFAQNSIQVVVGVQAAKPEQIVTDYLEGRLQTGANVCDH